MGIGYVFLNKFISCPCLLLPGRPRSRHTRGTTPRCCWWGTSVTWMMSGWCLETEPGSSQTTSVSSPPHTHKQQHTAVFPIHRPHTIFKYKYRSVHSSPYSTLSPCSKRRAKKKRNRVDSAYLYTRSGSSTMQSIGS